MEFKKQCYHFIRQLSVVVFLALPIFSYADIWHWSIWTGEVDSEWSSADNWNDVVPDYEGAIAIFVKRPEDQIQPVNYGDIIIDGIVFNFAKDSFLVTNAGDMRLTGIGIMNNSGINQVIRNDGTLTVESNVGDNISIENNGSILFDSNINSFYRGDISGKGVVIKRGAGILTFIGNANPVGGFFIENGILQFGNDEFDGFTDSFICNSSELIFNYNHDATYSGVIFGNGGVIKSGKGKLTFTGENIYTGLTVVREGELQIGDSVTTGFIVSDIINEANLIFSRADDLVYNGTISGNGVVEKSGPGKLIFTGNNVYSGVTVIHDGVLQLGYGREYGMVSGDIMNNASLIFNRSDSLVFAGHITGAGTVQQSGTGTLTLTGNNTYTGNTTVNQGELLISNNGTLVGDILNNSLLAFNPSHVSTYNGVISGSGTVLKQGKGTLVLNGTNLYETTTVVESGTLLVGGDEEHSDAQLLGKVVVYDGATLGGHGYIADIENHGMVAPAASIGVLNVSGNYTQPADGNLLIELDNKGQSDLLDVAGTMMLDGTLAIDVSKGFIPEFRYQFIYAESGINGQFNNIDSSGLLQQGFLTAEVELQNNLAFITPSFNKAAMLNAANSLNRLAVTQHILSTGGTAATQALLASASNTSEFVRSTDQLSAATYANQQWQLSQTARWLDSELADRMHAETGFWLTPYAGFSGIEAGNAGGLDTAMGGMTLGIDFKAGQQGQWGLAFASSYFSSDATGTEIASDEGSLYQMAVYGSYQVSQWMLGISATVGTTDAVDANRTIGDDGVSGSYIATVLSQQARVDYSIAVKKTLLRPFVAMLAQQVGRDAFSESGASGLALNLKKSSYHSLRSQLGMSLEIPLNYLKLMASASW